MKNNKVVLILASLFALMFFTAPAAACSPVPQFMVFFMAPQAWGIFTGIGLVVVVALKCFLFTKWSGLSARRAILLMVWANIFSTIPGLCGVYAFAAPVYFIPVGLIIVIAVCLFAAISINSNEDANTIGSFKITVLLLIGMLVSSILFMLSQNAVEANHAMYWLLKTLYAILAVAVGLAVTTGFEFGTIKRSLQKSDEMNPGIFNAVVRSNLYAMLISVGIAAAFMLPRRLASPDFLAKILDYIKAIV